MIMQRLTGILCYAIGVFGIFMTVSSFFYGAAFRRRHADTGDFTGAAMLESFFTIYVLPLAIIALVAGVALLPPKSMIARASPVAPGEGALAPVDEPPWILALALPMLGIAHLAYTRWLLGETKIDLALIGLVFSPGIAMTIVLSVAAWRLARPRR